MSSSTPLPALVAEAAKKSRVCWLSWDGRPPRLAWHAWYDDAVVVLCGDGQELPGLATSGVAEVTLRSKDTGGRLVSCPVAVERVDPDGPRWDEHAAALLAVRLNLPDPAAAVARWRSGATVVRLAPMAATGPDGSRPLP